MNGRVALAFLLTVAASTAHARVMMDWSAPGGGSIRPGNDTDACASTNSGAISYSGGVLSYCNGSIWTTLAAGSTSGTTAAAGVTGSVQFRDGNGGLTGSASLKYSESGSNSALSIIGNSKNNLLEIGNGSGGNYNSYIDLVGDATYTDFGLRILRDNSGPDAATNIPRSRISTTLDAGCRPNPFCHQLHRTYSHNAGWQRRHRHKHPLRHPRCRRFRRQRQIPASA